MHFCDLKTFYLVAVLLGKVECQFDLAGVCFQLYCADEEEEHVLCDGAFETTQSVKQIKTKQNETF